MALFPDRLEIVGIPSCWSFNNELSMVIRSILFLTLPGAKALDSRDFCRGIDIMSSGGHLTETGLAQLKSLCLNMNSSRTKS